MTLSDQSYCEYSTTDTSVLTRIETEIAGYATAVMGQLGQLAPVPDAAAFFPSGSVDWKKGAFTKPTPAAPTLEQTSPAFPGTIAAGETVTVIETSEELRLTQNQKLAGSEHYFPVPDTHLLVYGDIVYVHGKIVAPGKHVVIFARELRTLADGTQKAELNVDAPSRQLDVPKFASAAPDGPRGNPATQNRQYWCWPDMGTWRWEPLSANDPFDIFGGKGGSGEDVAAGSPWFRKANPEINGQDGLIGATGVAGGDIYIVCGSAADTSDLTLSSQGAEGGQGGTGQNGGTGGPGGPGADFRWGNYRRPDGLGEDQSAYSAMVAGPGGNGGHGGIGGPGGVGGTSGNCLVVVNQPLGANTTITHGLRPGEPGPRGIGGMGGAPGADGIDGGCGNVRVNINDEDAYAFGLRKPKYWREMAPELEARAGRNGDDRLKDLQASGAPLPAALTTPAAKSGRYLTIHNCAGDFQVKAPSKDARSPQMQGLAKVSHLHMLLETIRFKYLQWDADRFAADADTPDVKEELTARLEFLSLAVGFLPKFVSDDDARVRDGLNATLTRLVLNLGKEWDYYGNSGDWVPLGSPDIYSDPASLALLQTREATYLAYLANLAQAKAVGEQRSSALADVGADLTEADQQCGTLRTALIDLMGKIAATDQPIAVARTGLETALAALGDWVKTCFGLTLQDFTECLFNLSFIQGPFTAFTTLSSQTLGMLDKAVNTIGNDEGQAVNRKHLLMQVDVMSKQLTDLSEAWTTIQDARNPSGPDKVQLSDPDSYRLLVAQQTLDDLLQQFYTKDTARAAMTAMDDYVSQIQQRNTWLADYNSLASEYLAVAGECKKLGAQQDEIAALKAHDAAPDLPAETAFVAALYNRTRERCIANCYLASRAFHFWSLAPDTVLHGTLKLGTPNEIDYQLLSGVDETLHQARADKIAKDLGNQVQDFPPSEADFDGTGICVVLREKTHPRLFERFKKTGVVTFRLSPPIKGSNKAENPFVACANVRITRVRPWIIGVKSDDKQCTVLVRQQGPEEIATRDRRIVTAIHDPMDFKFVYNWSKVSWNDQGGYVEKPADALKHGGSDGSLERPDNAVNSKYLPLIGPFAEWQLTLDPHENNGLDLSAVTAICMDFHGFSQDFDR